ncbi:hypothetical protein OG897_30020 [Streptomyces sp. NBC_00237]|uniref:hypothetical protein n=1 Tax=Streptomyces sp. NBC_00237 TaxID=2975687 RepID=UPI0022542B10|nr:hypothetical protein [Streptomyces sp. NBC_00237]MCX5205678.1 hypothetical protein [Streptomyces sp. NBC_00237]
MSSSVPVGHCRDTCGDVPQPLSKTCDSVEQRNHSGRWVCVTCSGGSIHDLHGHNLNDQTRSLKINKNDCG